MRVLVTGGTGFLGAWTAKAVADAGHRVRFLVRDPSRLTAPAALGVDTADRVVGDITDADSVRLALLGCDAVVHCAAVVATDRRRAREMLTTNTVGATHVLGIAAELGLDPIVHVSSFTVLFHPGATTVSAELPVVGGSDAYGRSKARVELYARGLQDAGAPVVVSYPGMVLGPAAGPRFGEGADGVEVAVRLRLLPGRHAGWTIVDVRDVAALHAAALVPGLGPRRYLCGGHRVGVTELAALFSEVTGRTTRAVPVPDAALRLLGRTSDALSRLVPFTSPLTEAAMQYYTRMPESDDSASERDLGLRYRDPGEVIADTISGLRAAGRLPRLPGRDES
ncbi:MULTISPECIES: NAD-dependent epimerase/dehydratase family protein [Nocardia]|uniref:NAD-dependent epimerase/dehydratase family protein n=1 Tax=Nocardia TaxID=1817 RepID=UPI000D695C00|nr:MULTISPECIES: NAD-dependent epimerase/dehydratase family protein [Nocardia]